LGRHGHVRKVTSGYFQCTGAGSPPTTAVEHDEGDDVSNTALMTALPRASGVSSPSLGSGSERRYRILPGIGDAEGILALPVDLAIEQIHVALDELKSRGWVLDVASYSRLRGPYHYYGLARAAGATVDAERSGAE
jgi:hypothetical protein